MGMVKPMLLFGVLLMVIGILKELQRWFYDYLSMGKYPL